MKVKLRFIGPPSILFGHLKYSLFLIFFKDLMHRLTERRVDYLSDSRLRLPSKVFPRPVIIVFIRPKIPHILRDNLRISFPLLLVFLDPFILINMIHKPMHTLYGLLG